MEVSIGELSWIALVFYFTIWCEGHISEVFPKHDSNTYRMSLWPSWERTSWQKGTTAKQQVIILRCKEDSGEFRLPVSSWSCPHSWARVSPPHLWGLWDCAKENALRRPWFFLPEPPPQPEHQHGEEQRKNLVFRNPVKMNCKNHARWSHDCNLCFWKSLPTSLLILKHTRNITEWRIPDSLRQQKTLKAVKKNYIFLRYFQSWMLCNFHLSLLCISTVNGRKGRETFDILQSKTQLH